eukprot:gene4915-5159_t
MARLQTLHALPNYVGNSSKPPAGSGRASHGLGKSLKLDPSTWPAHRSCRSSGRPIGSNHWTPPQLTNINKTCSSGTTNTGSPSTASPGSSSNGGKEAAESKGQAGGAGSSSAGSAAGTGAVQGCTAGRSGGGWDDSDEGGGGDKRFYKLAKSHSLDAPDPAVPSSSNATAESCSAGKDVVQHCPVESQQHIAGTAIVPASGAAAGAPCAGTTGPWKLASPFAAMPAGSNDWDPFSHHNEQDDESAQPAATTSTQQPPRQASMPGTEGAVAPEPKPTGEGGADAAVGTVTGPWRFSAAAGFGDSSADDEDDFVTLREAPESSSPRTVDAAGAFELTDLESQPTSLPDWMVTSHGLDSAPSDAEMVLGSVSRTNTDVVKHTALQEGRAGWGLEVAGTATAHQEPSLSLDGTSCQHNSSELPATAADGDLLQQQRKVVVPAVPAAAVVAAAGAAVCVVGEGPGTAFHAAGALPAVVAHQEALPTEVHLHVAGLDQLAVQAASAGTLDTYRVVAFHGSTAVAEVRGLIQGSDGLLRVPLPALPKGVLQLALMVKDLHLCFVQPLLVMPRPCAQEMVLLWARLLQARLTAAAAAAQQQASCTPRGSFDISCGSWTSQGSDCSLQSNASLPHDAPAGSQSAGGVSSATQQQANLQATDAMAGATAGSRAAADPCKQSPNPSSGVQGPSAVSISQVEVQAVWQRQYVPVITDVAYLLAANMEKGATTACAAAAAVPAAGPACLGQSSSNAGSPQSSPQGQQNPALTVNTDSSEFKALVTHLVQFLAAHGMWAVLQLITDHVYGAVAAAITAARVGELPDLKAVFVLAWIVLQAVVCRKVAKVATGWLQACELAWQEPGSAAVQAGTGLAASFMCVLQFLGWLVQLPRLLIVKHLAGAA